MTEPAPLPRFPDEDLRRVLCVAAHPDDLEYGASAAVATWTARGVEVVYLLLTRGEAGIDTSPPEETARVREREQRAAGAAVGVSRVDFLDHADGVLTYSLDLRRDVARAVRRLRPDVVLTPTWAEEPGWGLNQADHRAAGLAVADGTRDAGNRWTFVELLEEEGLEPWSPRWLLVAGDPRPTHGVELTGEALERGITSLEAHAAYFAALPDHPPAREMLTEYAEAEGRRMGAQYAVLFRAHSLG